MVSFVRSPVARVSLLAAALLMCAAESSAEAQQSLRHLDNKDLADVAQAKLDKSFNEVAEGAFRRLQGGPNDDDAFMYMESEAPTGSPTMDTFEPSFAPTMMEDSFAPTSSPSIAPTMAPSEASGASSWRPSSAGVAAASLVVGVVSAFAMA